MTRAVLGGTRQIPFIDGALGDEAQSGYLCVQMAVLTERLGRIRGPACAIPGGPGKRSKKAGRQTGWLLDTF